MALNTFMIIVLAHWAEHLVQAYQIWVLGRPRPQARGVLGQFFPVLVTQEWLHLSGYGLDHDGGRAPSDGAWQARCRVPVAALALTGAGVALLFAFSPSGPAVTSATPPEGAALAAAPDAVQLTVSRRPDPRRSHISVVDGAGVLVVAGPLGAVGTDGLRLPVTITGRGTFTVAYHVELAGGGELTGSWRFGVGAAPQGAPPPVAAHEHGVDPIGATLLVVDGVVVLCVVVLLVLRRPARARR